MYDKKQNNKLVSVIIPVYNAEKYIKQTILSVIAQDYPYIEIVIVDDCSTDHSSEIIHQLMYEFPCIVYERLNENSGVAAARNTAIKIAKGRFIAFLDSDDLWKSGKIQAQIELFKKYKETPFTYTAIEYIDEAGHLLKNKRNLKEKVTYDFLLRNTVIATSTVMIDREIVKEIVMPNRRSAEDYSLWLAILKKYGAAYGINETYTSYRKVCTSLSSNRIGEVKYFYAVQTEDMQINPLTATINTLCYIANAVRKHFL